jgi:hypothetical protein
MDLNSLFTHWKNISFNALSCAQLNEFTKDNKVGCGISIIGCMEYEKPLSTLTFMTWKDFKISFVNVWIWWFIVCITFLYFWYFLSWQCHHSLDWGESKEGFLGLSQKQSQMFNGSLSLCKWKALGFLNIVGLIMKPFHTHILWVSLHYKCWACLVHLLAYKWVKTYWGIPFERQGKILKTLKLTFFFTKLNTYPKFPPYFSCQMKQISSNLIYEFKVFFFFFSFMKIKIIKFIQCELCSINDPQFPKFSLFGTCILQ